MLAFRRLATSCPNVYRLQAFVTQINIPHLKQASQLKVTSTNFSSSSFENKKAGDDEWNESWERSWLPEDLKGKDRAPWETDVSFLSSESAVMLPSDADSETKAFVEEMNENWNDRRRGSKTQQQENLKKDGNESSPYSLENMKKDYRMKKQRIHAALWVKEIEKQEEAKLGDSLVGGGDEIDRLLNSCSEIFDSGNNDFNDLKIPSSSEFKNKPDGWETISKSQDENIWEMSQREEDILVQEFDRRIAYNKFQIASFIKQHIFSRRRPIDGWKYMIEVIGPNARKGRGSVSRKPGLSDVSTLPFKEESSSFDSIALSQKGS